MKRFLFAPLLALSLVAACSSGTPAPKPLPGGPPPEYEPPRAFDAGIEMAPLPGAAPNAAPAPPHP